MRTPREALRVMLAAEALGLEESASLSEAREAAEQLETELGDYPATSRLISLALTMLREESLWRIAEKSQSRTFAFSNAERMWELTVALLIDESLAQSGHAGYSVVTHPMRGSSLRLIDPSGPEIDPDVLVYKGTSVAVVADAKYGVTAAAAAQDVYQIYSYVQRLGAPIGILLYLSEGPSWWKELGKTAAGSSLIAAGVSEEEVSTKSPGPALQALVNAFGRS
jgi:hypothetical protein